MEGDIVKITAQATEVNGIPSFEAKIGEKPQFMLDEEFNQLIFGCALEALKVACKLIYPSNEELQKKLAVLIANKIGD